ncbi:MAG: hypothetical protein LBP99_09350 [Azoarcus sp.]|jgi:hypothetical protein|nr:hypothetical protein [Azoarcus sp.]
MTTLPDLELQRLDLREFLFKLTLANGIDTKQAWQITVPEFPRPISLKFINIPLDGLSGKPVVFNFHGAVDRAKRTVPFFGANYIKSWCPNALVIAIADPMLEVHADLRVAWYAGSETLNVPELLRQLVTAILQTLGASRVVFVGASTGGHAALVQSWHVPGSIVVVSNPICSISPYYEPAVREYLQTCWPSLGYPKRGSWPKSFVDFAERLYAERCDNNVIYLTNADDRHFWRQAAPFFYAVRQGNARTRLMLISNYNTEYSGHATSPSVLGRWVAAACQAPTAGVTDIAKKANELAVAQAVIPPNLAKKPDGTKLPCTQDVEIANKLLDLLN